MRESENEKKYVTLLKQLSLDLYGNFISKHGFSPNPWHTSLTFSSVGGERDVVTCVSAIITPVSHVSVLLKNHIVHIKNECFASGTILLLSDIVKV